MTDAIRASERSSRDSIAVDDATGLALAERFVRALRAGRATEAAALVSADVPPGRMDGERLTAIWAQLTARFGELEALRPLDVVAEGAFHAANLAARFARSELTIRVVLDRRNEVAGFWVSEPRPPAYEPPAYVHAERYTERDLSIGDGATALGATLSLPVAGGPHPAVVLVHGSGPNDRDETLGANRPFRDLAWGLASRGVAVLRYDKRTYAHPRQYASAEWDTAREVLDDAVDAVRVARAQPEIDSARVFVLGHSLGAGLAPMIATRADAAGVVMLAAAGRPITDALIEQIEYLDALAANPATAAQRDELVAQLRALAAGTVAAETPVLGAPASYWYELGSHDVLAAARAFDRPVLVLQGARDYQVTERDLELWREAFARNARARLVLYPDLNHLFMTGTGRSTPAEYTAHTGHVAEPVIADVQRFVAEA